MHEIANKKGRPVRKDAGYRMLSAVLHTLRNELDLQEVFMLSNQLPCCIRGLFFENYDPEKVPVIMYNKTFMDRYYSKMGPGNSRYLEHYLISNHSHYIGLERFIESVNDKLEPNDDMNTAAAVKAVLKVLQEKTAVNQLNLDKLNYLLQEAVPEDV